MQIPDPGDYVVSIMRFKPRHESESNLSWSWKVGAVRPRYQTHYLVKCRMSYVLCYDTDVGSGEKPLDEESLLMRKVIEG